MTTPTYYCLPTAYGRAKLAAKVLAEEQLRLTEMAVGDGAGNEVIPHAGQVSLVREVYRRPINAVFSAAENPDTFIVEMVIPPEVGPFVVREVGVFDEDGELFATAKIPASTKPVLEEGSTKDMVIHCYIKIADSASVVVTINPLTVVATRMWVEANFLLLPSGNGTTHQLVRKKNNNFNEWEFFDPAFDATSFIFDAIEETQTLAVDQTTVYFSSITTAGIAVYLQNEATDFLKRLIKDRDYTITDETHIELAASYPDGTTILGVQNDPNGNITPHGIGALERNENLNDVQNKESARSNIGLAYADKTEAEGGSLLNRVLSPLRGLQLILSRLASQAQAEAGADNERLMTPLRVKQLLDKFIPRAQRGHEVGEIGMFYRKTVPADAWLPLQGGTFGPAGSLATKQQRDDCWDLYALWWSEFSQEQLPVTGGRGSSAAADWAAKKPMAIFNDVNQFYRAWNSGGARGFATLEDDAIQNITGKIEGISETFGSFGGTANGVFGKPTNGPNRGGTPTSADYNNSGTIDFDASRVVRTGPETTVKNRNVLTAVHK